MKQQSLTDGFEKFRKKTRKEQFLEDMEVIIPWPGLVETIAWFKQPGNLSRYKEWLYNI